VLVQVSERTYLTNMKFVKRKLQIINIELLIWISNFKRSDNFLLKKINGYLGSCLEPTQPLLVQLVMVQAHVVWIL